MTAHSLLHSAKLPSGGSYTYTDLSFSDFMALARRSSIRRRALSAPGTKAFTLLEMNLVFENTIVDGGGFKAACIVASAALRTARLESFRAASISGINSFALSATAKVVKASIRTMGSISVKRATKFDDHGATSSRIILRVSQAAI